MRRVDISSEINSRNRHEMQESLVYSLDLIGGWCWRAEVNKVVVWQVGHQGIH